MRHCPSVCLSAREQDCVKSFQAISAKPYKLLYGKNIFEFVLILQGPKGSHFEFPL